MIAEQCAILKTPWHSWYSGKLPRGCALCVQGKKLVLFITGICPQRCFYCPVSEHKFGNDVAYANEWKIADPKNPVELIKEAELTDAKGAGITGGDPLANISRCCAYIIMLKQRFGKAFHIHLYTPLALVTPGALKKLHDADLDEIRLHPNLDNDKLWGRLSLARAFDWSVGVEIPAVPGYEEKTKRLIDFIAGKVDFLNLNELELSDTQVEHYELNKRGFAQKDAVSYGVAGSAAMGRQMAAYAKAKGIDVHVCTAALKDGVQVAERIKIRASHVALPFDEKSNEGTLLRGCAYLPSLAPGAGYRKKLNNAPRSSMIEELMNLRGKVVAVVHADVVVDEEKPRLLMARSVVKKHASALKKLGLVPALVEEYPTADAFEIDVEIL